MHRREKSVCTCAGRGRAVGILTPQSRTAIVAFRSLPDFLDRALPTQSLLDPSHVEKSAPLLPTFEQSPTMTWSPVVGAASYSVALRNAVTGTILNAVTGLTGTSWTVPTSLAAGRYRWWVSAASSEAFLSPSPQVIDFAVGGQPTVLGPTGSVTSTTPQFTWTAVTGAATYDLWVNRIGSHR